MLRHSLVRSFAGKAAAASGTTSKPIATSSGGYRLKFDPKAIMPHEYGHVRIINNTTRDAQQSNCSAEMAHEHRIVRCGRTSIVLLRGCNNLCCMVACATFSVVLTSALVRFSCTGDHQDD